MYLSSALLGEELQSGREREWSMVLYVCTSTRVSFHAPYKRGSVFSTYTLLSLRVPFMTPGLTTVEGTGAESERRGLSLFA